MLCARAIPGLRGQSMVCTRHKPWIQGLRRTIPCRIAQIHALRVTYIISILNDVDSNLSLFVIRASLAKADVIWDPPLCGAGCGSAMKSHR